MKRESTIKKRRIKLLIEDCLEETTEPDFEEITFPSVFLVKEQRKELDTSNKNYVYHYLEISNPNGHNPKKEEEKIAIVLDKDSKLITQIYNLIKFIDEPYPEFDMPNCEVAKELKIILEQLAEQLGEPYIEVVKRQFSE